MGRGARGAAGRNAAAKERKRRLSETGTTKRDKHHFRTLRNIPSFRRATSGANLLWRIRQRALALTKTSAFRTFVLCAILANSLALCLPDAVCKLCLDEQNGSTASCLSPAVNGSATWQYRIASHSVLHGNGTWAPCTESAIQMLDFTDLLEYAFTAVFTLELVIQVTAKGLILGKQAYLRDAWNWLDFVVVVMSYASVVGGLGNVSSVRTFRVLRPLRTLTTIPGMKVLVTSLMASVPAMFNVVLMSLLMFFGLGVIGIQLWGGMLSSRCFMQPVSDTALAFAWSAAESTGASDLTAQVASLFNESRPYVLDDLDGGMCARQDLALAFGRSCDPGT
jgi:hypothetical protein